MRRSVVLGILFVAGCHEVFGLKEIEVPATCGAMRDPGLDEDRDGVVNGEDVCPTVPLHPPDDEDGDLAPDACDLCPQLVADAAGDDPDCDGLGAACDPDSTIPHERRFYGFESAGGFRFEDPSEDGTVGGGELRMDLTNDNTTSVVIMNEPGARFASYELAGRFDNAMLPQFWNITIELDDAAGREYELQLEKSSTHELRLVIEHQGDVELKAVPLGKLTDPSPVFRLRADVTPEGISGLVLVDDLSAPINIPAAMAPIDAPIEYGLYIYRDNNATTSTCRVDYYVYTAAVAQ